MTFAGQVQTFTDKDAAFGALLKTVQLHNLGHAVSSASEFDDHGNFLQVQITHYRTCKACEKENNHA